MTHDQVSRPLGPASSAARRTAKRPHLSRPYERPEDTDVTGTATALAATRALLVVRSRDEAAHVLLTAIGDLGGAVAPARLAEAHPDALPVDVSLGAGEPLLVIAPALSVEALLLGRHLPSLLQDALDAAGRCDLRQQRLETALTPGISEVDVLHVRDEEES